MKDFLLFTLKTRTLSALCFNSNSFILRSRLRHFLEARGIMKIVSQSVTIEVYDHLRSSGVTIATFTSSQDICCNSFNAPIYWYFWNLTLKLSFAVFMKMLNERFEIFPKEMSCVLCFSCNILRFFFSSRSWSSLQCLNTNECIQEIFTVNCWIHQLATFYS